jgi:citrate synthase
VLFSVSRAIGVCSQAVIAGALGLAITKPKSVTTKWIQSQVMAAPPAVAGV